jgi:hypothetical protein
LANFSYTKKSAASIGFSAGMEAIFERPIRCAVWPAQGIEAVYFFATGKKDTSG